MITLAFYNADCMLIRLLTFTNRQEEAEALSTLFQQLQEQIGWDSTLPTHHFCTQPLMGSGHKRRVIYYASGNMVGWYVYHDDMKDASI